LRRFDVWIINLIVSVFTATITEVVSNTAAANILLPILKEMSITLCTNPTYLGSLVTKKLVLGQEWTKYNMRAFSSLAGYAGSCKNSNFSSCFFENYGPKWPKKLNGPRSQ
jgi:hypothetical protein